MKAFKAHFGVSISLFALLFSLQCGIFVNNLILKYSNTMKNEYTIMLVSSLPLSLSGLKQSVQEVKNINPISTDLIISKFKGKISDDSLKLLSNSLPKFYNVELKFFPNFDELNTIRSKLTKINGIERVEVFQRKHDNIYRILILTKTVVYIFITLIIILSLMLMNKQIKIWIFEHKERLDVMTLFGASFFEKSISLYRLAIIDSIIATFLVTLFFCLLPLNHYFIALMQIINIKVNPISLSDFFILLFTSWILSISGVSSVMRRSKDHIV